MTSNPWLCDAAVTCHSTHNSDGIYYVEGVQETAIIGDGNRIQITKNRK